MKKHDLYSLHAFTVKIIFYEVVIICLLQFIVPSYVCAHKVNIFAYVEGDKVHVQSYFSDGTAARNAKIEVFDRAGNTLLTGITDKQGEFTFKLPKTDDIRIVLCGSLGHRAETWLSGSKLQDVSKEKYEGVKAETGNRDIQIDLEQMRNVIEQVIDAKLQPIIKMIARNEARGVSMVEIIGGIGYIFGIMGLVIYFQNRKKNKNCFKNGNK